MTNAKASRRETEVFSPNAEFITEKQAAKKLALAPRTLRNWRVRGCGPPFIRISARCIRYRVSDIEAWASAGTL